MINQIKQKIPLNHLMKYRNNFTSNEDSPEAKRKQHEALIEQALGSALTSPEAIKIDNRLSSRVDQSTKDITPSGDQTPDIRTFSQTIDYSNAIAVPPMVKDKFKTPRDKTTSNLQNRKQNKKSLGNNINSFKVKNTYHSLYVDATEPSEFFDKRSQSNNRTANDNDRTKHLYPAYNELSEIDQLMKEKQKKLELDLKEKRLLNRRGKANNNQTLQDINLDYGSTSNEVHSKSMLV